MDGMTDRAKELLDKMWNEYVRRERAARELRKAEHLEDHDSLAAMEAHVRELETILMTLPDDWCHIAAVQQAIRLYRDEDRHVGKYGRLLKKCGRDYWAELSTQSEEP